MNEESVIDQTEAPLGGWTPTGYEGLRSDDLRTILQLGMHFQKQKNESRAAAIRYEGQMDFQKLVASGVPANEALLQTAHKMFYQEPAGFAATYQRQAAAEAAERRTAAEQAYRTQRLSPPTVHVVEDPITKKKTSVIEMGGRMEKFPDASSTQQRKLEGIQLDALKAENQALSKAISAEVDPNSKLAVEKRQQMLANQTAMSNIINQASSPVAVGAPAVVAPPIVGPPATNQQRFVWDRQTGKLIPKQ